MRVLLVPSGTARVASARIRAYQYVAPLSRSGFDCTLIAASSDLTARLRLKSTRMSRVAKLSYYALATLDRTVRMAPILVQAARSDVVYIQRTTFPGAALAILRRLNPRLVFDFDDAIQLRDPGDGESGFIARMKELANARDVAAVLGASSCAVVEHHVLEEYAREHCHRVERIPGPIDTDWFSPGESRPPNDRPVIGWIGSPSTSAYLPIVAGVLRRLAAKLDFEVHLVGSGPFPIDGVNVRTFEWQQDEERDRLRRFDVGIMPMPNTEWTRGKLGVKMLMYMACEIPSVVSYTPVNAEVIEHGANGFIVDGDDAWEATLEALIRDAALRRRVGRAGRETIVDRYSLVAGSAKLMRILREVAAQ